MACQGYWHTKQYTGQYKRPHYLDFILICGPLAEYYLRKC